MRKRSHFSCEICSQSFSVKFNLSQHVKAVHEGEKSISCDICHSSFSQKRTLSQQFKSVDEEEK